MEQDEAVDAHLPDKTEASHTDRANPLASREREAGEAEAEGDERAARAEQNSYSGDGSEV